MSKDIIKRVIDEAYYMIDTGYTVRDLARVFNVSKSTVHKDLHERLIDINHNLYLETNKILQYHTDIRHIRGGESTKKKYLDLSD
ncbi:MAG: sporulation transcriptional regulator SpoIIID [Bacilli bacterium]